MWWWRTTNEPYLLVADDLLYKLIEDRWVPIGIVRDMEWILDYSVLVLWGRIFIWGDLTQKGEY